jgi:hypothetical protein
VNENEIQLESGDKAFGFGLHGAERPAGIDAANRVDEPHATRRQRHAVAGVQHRQRVLRFETIELMSRRAVRRAKAARIQPAHRLALPLPLAQRRLRLRCSANAHTLVTHCRCVEHLSQQNTNTTPQQKELVSLAIAKTWPHERNDRAQKIEFSNQSAVDERLNIRQRAREEETYILI